MKKTITETVSREIDIELPAYRTDGSCHWYKVISETQAIAVYLSNHGHGGTVDIHNTISIAFGSLTKDITENEFNEKFNAAMQLLHNSVYPNDMQDAPTEDLPYTLCEEIKHNAKEKTNGL